MNNKPLTIFFINHDWRNIFRESFHELTEKLERDQMNPRLNNFFFFSYAHSSYTQLEGQYQTAHIKTRLGKFKPLLDISSLFRIPLIAKKYDQHPDTWVVSDFGAIPGAWVAKRFYGGKIVMMINNQPVIYSRTRKFGRIKGAYMWFIQKLFYRLVDHFFTINQTMVCYLIDIGVTEKNVTIFSMNTITRDFDEIKEAKSGVIKTKYNIPTNSKILLTVARLEAEKNYPRLIELFAGLGDGHVLIALGRGSMLEILQEQARSLGIAERVIFPGYVERNEIWNYYKDADAFVLISKAEALGIVLWEAMYLNVPVLSSDVAGIMETVGEDGVRARVWRESDGQAGFNERVRFCTEICPERDAMIERAKDFVEKQLQNKVTINTLPIFSEK